MPDDPTTDAADDGRSRLELLTAVLLGLAALAAAWAAFQSGKVSGDATNAANDATTALVDANFFYNKGNQQVESDTQLFITYIEDDQSGDAELASYVFGTLMDPNLQEAVLFFEDASTEALTPFDEVEGNPYHVADFDEAEAQEAASEAALQAVADANEKGDRYDLAGVLLAVALFIGGIGTLFKRPVLSWYLLAGGAVALVAGATITVAA